MADAFTGEIRVFGFQFAPQDWAECLGQKINITQNPALASVLGNRFGGDLQTYFNLPNMPGKTPIGTGSAPDTGMGSITLGQNLGVDTVTINGNQVPQHNHSLNGYGTPTPSKMVGTPTATTAVFSPVNMTFTTPPRYPGYNATATVDGYMDPGILAYDGGVASPGPHDNHQPYLPMRFFICTYGIYPINPN